MYIIYKLPNFTLYDLASTDWPHLTAPSAAAAREIYERPAQSVRPLSATACHL